MKPLTLYLTVGFVVTQYERAAAISTYTYDLTRQSIFFVISAGCLLLALSIYSVLKGGSLGASLVFLIIGFALATASGLIGVLDLLKILIYPYDLRLATLLTTCGSALSLLLGLYLYRRGLD
jgi:hypothetical protein